MFTSSKKSNKDFYLYFKIKKTTTKTSLSDGIEMKKEKFLFYGLVKFNVFDV